MEKYRHLFSWCFKIKIKGFQKYRNNHPEVFYKKGVFRNFAKFTGKHLCQDLFFNNVAGPYIETSQLICCANQLTGFYKRAWSFIKKETLTQMFSCEFCKISKNTYSYRTPLVVASENINFGFLKNTLIWDRLQLFQETISRGVGIRRCSVLFMPKCDFNKAVWFLL